MTGAKLNGKHTYQDFGLKLKGIELGISEQSAIRNRLPASDFFTLVDPKLFKQKTVGLIFDCEGDYEAWMEKIDVLSEYVNGLEVEVEIDSKPGVFYYGTATVTTTKEAYIYSEFVITILADPIQYGTETSVDMNRITSKTITVEGNHAAPCIIEITPTGDIIDYTITGAARNKITGTAEPIKLTNLKTGKKVIINGEDGTILQDGQNKYGESDFWEFPTLLPGRNTITVSNALCNVTIKYKPRYL